MIESVENLTSLDREYEEGECVYCKADQQVYTMHNGEWVIENAASTESKMSVSLYSLNQQIVSQMGMLNDEQLKDKIILINNWSNDNQNIFYLMYGKEIGYFTLFT